jgi:hypothetical protein
MRTQYKLDTQTFITRSNEKHNGKYDYSKTEYRNFRTKVVITCPLHGDFQQTPKNHLKGEGCPLCGKEYAKTWRKRKYQHFTEESKRRFGNTYSFPLIEEEYENSHSRVTVHCNLCNYDFTKIACDHLTSETGGCQHLDYLLNLIHEKDKL